MDSLCVHDFGDNSPIKIILELDSSKTVDECFDILSKYQNFNEIDKKLILSLRYFTKLNTLYIPFYTQKQRERLNLLHLYFDLSQSDFIDFNKVENRIIYANKIKNHHKIVNGIHLPYTPYNEYEDWDLNIDEADSELYKKNVTKI